MDGLDPTELEGLYERLSYLGNADAIEAALRQRWVKDKKTGQVSLQTVRDSRKIRELAEEVAKPREVEEEIEESGNPLQIKEAMEELEEVDERFEVQIPKLERQAERKKTEIDRFMAEQRAEREETRLEQRRQTSLDLTQEEVIAEVVDGIGGPKRQLNERGLNAWAKWRNLRLEEAREKWREAELLT